MIEKCLKSIGAWLAFLLIVTMVGLAVLLRRRNRQLASARAEIIRNESRAETTKLKTEIAEDRARIERDEKRLQESLDRMGYGPRPNSKPREK